MIGAHFGCTPLGGTPLGCSCAPLSSYPSEAEGTPVNLQAQSRSSVPSRWNHNEETCLKQLF